jgi:hypothetical protein
MTADLAPAVNADVLEKVHAICAEKSGATLPEFRAWLDAQPMPSTDLTGYLKARTLMLNEAAERHQWDGRFAIRGEYIIYTTDQARMYNSADAPPPTRTPVKKSVSTDDIRRGLDAINAWVNNSRVSGVEIPTEKLERYMRKYQEGIALLKEHGITYTYGGYND